MPACPGSCARPGPSLEALQSAATADPAWFWSVATDDIAIPWMRRPREIADLSRGPAWARWWIGGSFDWSGWRCRATRRARPRRDSGHLGGQPGTLAHMTNRDLALAVRRAANQLHDLGIAEGDRVGILLPMLFETVLAVLAVSRIGAIFTPIFSGYGAPAIASRLADATRSCSSRPMDSCAGVRGSTSSRSPTPPSRPSRRSSTCWSSRGRATRSTPGPRSRRPLGRHHHRPR